MSESSRDTRIKKFDERLHRDVRRIGLNLFTNVARFLDVPRGIGASYGEKNRPIQSDGWGKSADKGAIVRQIFIRSLEILHCAKIEGLRVAGIAEVEKDGETGFGILRL